MTKSVNPAHCIFSAAFHCIFQRLIRRRSFFLHENLSPLFILPDVYALHAFHLLQCGLDAADALLATNPLYFDDLVIQPLDLENHRVSSSP